MEIKFFLFTSLFFLTLCMESNFDIQFSNWNESRIISSLKKTYVEVEASFGSHMDKFKLALDVDTQATVIPGIDSSDAGNNKKFDISKTTTFTEQKNFTFSSGEKFTSGIYGKDSFKLGNSETKNDISFVVAKGYSSTFLNNLYKYAFIGLKTSLNYDEYNFNIIGQMKDKNLISNATWFLNFDSDTKGKFIIGTLPHLKYKNIYSEDYMHSENCLTNYIYSINFGEIYYGKIENYDNRKAIEDSNHRIVKFNLNTRLFECTSDFGDILYKNFFKNQIDNGICYQGIIEDDYRYYYCKKDKFKMSEMENINFVTNRQNNNMTFVFEPKDLFFEHKDILYFLIIYQPDYYGLAGLTEWVAGTSFLKKYILTFNRNDRIIYFYEKKIDPTDEEEDGGDSSKYIIIIVVLSVVFVACIAFLIFYIIKIRPRRKKANELDDDDFDYQTKQNEEGNSALINDDN